MSVQDLQIKYIKNGNNNSKTVQKIFPFEEEFKDFPNINSRSHLLKEDLYAITLTKVTFECLKEKNITHVIQVVRLVCEGMDTLEKLEFPKEVIEEIHDKLRAYQIIKSPFGSYEG